MNSENIVVEGNVKKSFDFKKILNHIKKYFSNPANIILVVFGIILAFFTIYPLISLVQATFSVSISEAAKNNLRFGSFTTLWWKRIFASSMSKTYFWVPLKNSILMSFPFLRFITMLFSFKNDCNSSFKLNVLISSNLSLI